MAKIKKTMALPPIPDKRYFAIGMVSKLCGVETHVLRYWEQEFKQYIRPVRRRGDRRYYQVRDIEIIRKIRELLYSKAFTIVGARQQLAIDLREADIPIRSKTILATIPAVSIDKAFAEPLPITQITQMILQELLLLKAELA